MFNIFNGNNEINNKELYIKKTNELKKKYKRIINEVNEKYDNEIYKLHNQYREELRNIKETYDINNHISSNIQDNNVPMSNEKNNKYFTFTFTKKHLFLSKNNGCLTCEKINCHHTRKYHNY